MAEYMDYNDYDYGFKSKKQKIKANIRLIIAILFLVCVVVFVIIRMPENVRTDFDPVYSNTHTVGEKKGTGKNEFAVFYEKYSDNDTLLFDEEFKNNYPNIYSLLYLEKKELSKGEVKAFDSDGYFVIARPYEVSRDKDLNGEYYDKDKTYIIGITGVDFYIFKYDIGENFKIEKPFRFSVRLHSDINTAVPYVERVYVKSDSFRLNFFSLSVEVTDEKDFDEITTNLTLTDGINKSEFENEFFIKQQFVKTTDNQDLISAFEKDAFGKRGDKSAETSFDFSTSVKKAEVGIKFDDTVYSKFNGFEIKNVQNRKYRIKVN